MKSYDGHINTQLFLEYAQDCTSVLDLFEKVKKIEDKILQGNIIEGLVKVMFNCRKVFGITKIEYANKNA